MISGDDIEAFSDDLATADTIVDRAKTGTTPFRHIRANEELPLIRAYVLMKDAAETAAKALLEHQQSVLDSMGCFDRNNKRTG